MRLPRNSEASTEIIQDAALVATAACANAALEEDADAYAAEESGRQKGKTEYPNDSQLRRNAPKDKEDEDEDEENDDDDEENGKAKIGYSTSGKRKKRSVMRTVMAPKKRAHHVQESEQIRQPGPYDVAIFDANTPNDGGSILPASSSSSFSSSSSLLSSSSSSSPSSTLGTKDSSHSNRSESGVNGAALIEKGLGEMLAKAAEREQVISLQTAELEALRRRLQEVEADNERLAIRVRDLEATRKGKESIAGSKEMKITAAITPLNSGIHHTRRSRSTGNKMGPRTTPIAATGPSSALSLGKGNTKKRSRCRESSREMGDKKGAAVN